MVRLLRFGTLVQTMTVRVHSAAARPATVRHFASALGCLGVECVPVCAAIAQMKQRLLSATRVTATTTAQPRLQTSSRVAALVQPLIRITRLPTLLHIARSQRQLQPVTTQRQ